MVQFMEWQVGKLRIHRIEEMIGPMFDPVRFFPDFDPAVFEANRDWLFPDHVEEASGRIVASMHSYLIDTGQHKILIDTCIGNDKPRMPFRNWHEMQTPWFENLRATGVKAEDIDFVMCTHLHVDHVGWNTQLKDGQWVPTFPNAKYIFAREEFEFWQAERNKPDPEDFNAVNNLVFDDSVMPILHQAELIEGETELIADLLRINPSPGHTPGSIAIEVSSGSHLGVFTGDICHHPIQVHYPAWNSAFCELPDQARTTRRQILERCAATDALMLPAHFGGSHVGHVRAGDEHFRFEFA